MIGGEPIDDHSVKMWFDNKENLPRLVNAYGPTETTVNTAIFEITSNLFHRRIGRPIANTRIYILDEGGEPVPIGVAGELYIGGVQVARGYLNRAELTAERFLRDRFVSDAEARMYKTGDLGRWLPDGTIEFLGRNDHQVKIRGFRIELGEIEARLREYPDVAETAVIAREDESGDKRLVAYYTSAGEDEASVGAEELRAHLSAKLPEYMVPAAYVRLRMLPLTPNGKLDRKALPAPDVDAYVHRGYEAPVGEIETTLAKIWADLLKVEQVGRYDNFFELGGHSLLAIRVITRMRELLSIEVPLSSIFSFPTLQSLASYSIDRQLECFDLDQLETTWSLIKSVKPSLPC
jgi:acyl carrier protein